MADAEEPDEGITRIIYIFAKKNNMESNIKKQPNIRKAHEAILSDNFINQLIAKKSDILDACIPTYRISNGKLEIIFSVEVEEFLIKVDEQIEMRKKQILSAYDCLE